VTSVTIATYSPTPHMTTLMIVSIPSSMVLVLMWSMKKGAAFYLLMKKEDEVQDHKQICIRNKKTGTVFSGVQARNMLGLPYHGTVKVVPGNHGT